MPLEIPVDESEILKLLDVPASGRIIALDLGTKKIGVAVCDELQLTTRRLPLIERHNWKDLLKKTKEIIAQYDAVALVLGLPYRFDGSESEMTADARRFHQNFSKSLEIPVFLQDERLSSITAKQQLYDSGHTFREILKRLDSEAATVILEEFIEFKNAQQKRLREDQ